MSRYLFILILPPRFSFPRSKVDSGGQNFLDIPTTASVLSPPLRSAFASVHPISPRQSTSRITWPCWKPLRRAIIWPRRHPSLPFSPHRREGRLARFIRASEYCYDPHDYKASTATFTESSISISNAGTRPDQEIKWKATAITAPLGHFLGGLGRLSMASGELFHHQSFWIVLRGPLRSRLTVNGIDGQVS